MSGTLKSQETQEFKLIFKSDEPTEPLVSKACVLLHIIEDLSISTSPSKKGSPSKKQGISTKLYETIPIQISVRCEYAEISDSLDFKDSKHLLDFQSLQTNGSLEKTIILSNYGPFENIHFTLHPNKQHLKASRKQREVSTSLLARL